MMSNKKLVLVSVFGLVVILGSLVLTSKNVFDQIGDSDQDVLGYSNAEYEPVLVSDNNELIAPDLAMDDSSVFDLSSENINRQEEESTGNVYGSNEIFVDNLAKDNKTEKQECNFNSLQEQFTCLLNNYRIDKGKNVLLIDDDLYSVAMSQSEWMFEQNQLTHSGRNGEKFSQRCIQAGTTCNAEVVANINEMQAQLLLDAWKDSSAHNIILLGGYTHVGLGSSGNYATGLFR